MAKSSSVALVLGLFLVFVALPPGSQANQILDCRRTTKDFSWGTNDQYESLTGIKLSNRNVELFHTGSSSGDSGRIVDDRLTPLTPAFPLPDTSRQPIAGINGDFAMVLVDGTRILLQPYDSTGHAIGTPILVYETSGSFSYLIVAVQLEDPANIVIVWQENLPTGSALRGRTFTHWIPTSDPFLVSPVGSFVTFDVASLTSGGFVVSWIDGTTLKLRTFNYNGTPLSASPTTVSRAATLFAIGSLKNVGGQFVIGWTSNADLNNTTAGRYVFGQIFDKNGTSVVSPFLIRTRYNTGYYDYTGTFVYYSVIRLSFVTFSNGRFIALYEELEDQYRDYQTVLYARRFLANGVALDSKEHPVLYHALLYQTIVLKSGGWLLYAEFGHGDFQQDRGFVLKAFVSFYDYIGIETHPILRRETATYKGLIDLSPVEIIEVSGDIQHSRLILFWASIATFHSEAFAFGLECTLRESQCYDDFQPTTNEQVENLNKLHDQRYPSVALYSESINQVVVWQSDAKSPGKFDIISRFNETTEVQLNSVSGGFHANPSVSMLSGDYYFAVWQSLNQDGSGWGIYGQRFYQNYTGEPEFLINDYTLSNQINPSISCSSVAGPRCVVVWQSLDQDARGYGVYAKQFFGYESSPEIRVNTETYNNQQNPKVAFLADGIHFVVTWQHMTDGDGWGVRYKVSNYFYVTDKTPVPYVLPGPDLKANTIIAGNQIQPSVAPYLTVNQFVIAWKSQLGDSNIVARLFDLEGPLTDDFQVSPVSGSQFGAPAVAPFYVGWAVTWQGADGIWLKTFNGTQPEDLVQVNVTPVGTQPSTPSIAGLPYNTTLVLTWESDRIDGSGYGIGIRKFGCIE